MKYIVEMEKISYEKPSISNSHIYLNVTLKQQKLDVCKTL